MNNIGYVEYIYKKTFEYLKQKRFQEGLELYNMLFSPENTLAMLQYVNDTDGCSYMQENMKTFMNYNKRQWKNEELDNKTLLVYNRRCGQGDIIMNARYVNLLIKQNANIVIEVNENLLDLYKYNFPNCKIVESYHGDYDYTIPQELLINLQKHSKVIPCSEGYLKVDPKLIKKYTSIFDTEKFKIGIFGFSRMIERSIPLQQMQELFEGNSQFQFYTLTAEELAAETKKLNSTYNVIELKPYIKNASDTAALMKNMDLIISTDSFPIHLAGALGVKSYLMLNKNSDWRWFNDTETTPWYDSVRIFKQKQAYTWQDVVRGISDALQSEFVR